MWVAPVCHSSLFCPLLFCPLLETIAGFTQLAGNWGMAARCGWRRNRGIAALRSTRTEEQSLVWCPLDFRTFGLSDLPSEAVRARELSLPERTVSLNSTDWRRRGRVGEGREGAVPGRFRAVLATFDAYLVGELKGTFRDARVRSGGDVSFKGEG